MARLCHAGPVFGTFANGAAPIPGAALAPPPRLGLADLVSAERSWRMSGFRWDDRLSRGRVVNRDDQKFRPTARQGREEFIVDNFLQRRLRQR